MTFFGHLRSLSLVLVVALAWFEEASSFSSLSLRAATTVPQHGSVTRMMSPRLMSSETTIYGRPQHLHNTRLAMAANDDSSDKEVTKAKERGSTDNSESPAQKNNVILMVPLFCKFVVVLLIKFLSDLVVFPTLFVYRLVGRTKRKIIALFQKLRPGSSFPSSIKPNGSTE